MVILNIHASFSCRIVVSKTLLQIDKGPNISSHNFKNYLRKGFTISLTIFEKATWVTLAEVVNNLHLLWISWMPYEQCSFLFTHYKHFFEKPYRCKWWWLPSGLKKWKNAMTDTGTSTSYQINSAPGNSTRKFLEAPKKNSCLDT